MNTDNPDDKHMPLLLAIKAEVSFGQQISAWTARVEVAGKGTVHIKYVRKAYHVNGCGLNFSTPNYKTVAELINDILPSPHTDGDSLNMEPIP
ncbi:hypothetical protein [Spirosoma sordidisoli]|uniref:Uncharacterized protein n=1 Tax=Spirosoma sordidisoli TaxID=2502893 RepID=A0A4Q2UJE8_9BACT|nr:hypothetical protein [Spirosoma sordidisoli]RYC69607.1 hypothetical protein EQG79_13470 [Spirosoma sordidisoli]